MPSENPGRCYLVYILALSLWIGAILLAPLLASTGTYEPLSRPIYLAFSWVCHQQGDRCLTLCGEPLAVCARCSSLYVGILLSSLVYPLVGHPPTPRIRWLLIAAAPLVLDGGTQLVGLRESTMMTRTITGLVFGVAMAFYIAPEVVPTIEILASRIRGRAAGGA